MGIRVSGIASGLDTEGIVSELMKVQRLKTTRLENNITKLNWKIEKWKTLNSKIYSFYTGPLAKLRLQGNFNAKKAYTSNDSKVGVTVSNAVPEGTHTLQIKSVASAQFVTGESLNTSINVTYDTKLKDLGMDEAVGSKIVINAGSNTVDFEIKENSTVGDFISALRNAGLNASFDTSLKRFFISSTKSGTENAFTITTEVAEGGNVDLSKLGLSQITKSVDENGKVTISAGGNVSVVNPADAVIIYNGAEFKSSSNVMNINGMTITVKDVTAEGEVINISVSKDSQAIYDMVKDFIKSYNEVLSELNKAYNADLARGYEPLTDEQKKVMTEEQIEKWENKIKDSLLRRDQSLNSIITAMRDCLSRSVTVNGKSYSLSSFGINSVDYTERGLLHLDGDPDDKITSSNEDKLMKAISENPDAVMEVFTKLTGELYKTMTEQMKSTPLKSALSFYNDKELNNTLKEYQDRLSLLEDRLIEMEDRYYRQFSAMESMMAKLNSQSGILGNLLGMNSQ